jgi:hypothetical protein
MKVPSLENTAVMRRGAGSGVFDAMTENDALGATPSNTTDTSFCDGPEMTTLKKYSSVGNAAKEIVKNVFSLVNAENTTGEGMNASTTWSFVDDVHTNVTST